MLFRNAPDVTGGSILAALGTVFFWYTVRNYDLGSAHRMGPGMFPAILGVLLTLLGVLIVIQALLSQARFPAIKIRAPLFVLGGMSAFALLVVPFGLAPAVVVTVFISSLAEERLRPLAMLSVSGVMAVMSWLVFGVGLGLPVAAFNWPF